MKGGCFFAEQDMQPILDQHQNVGGLRIFGEHPDQRREHEAEGLFGEECQGQSFGRVHDIRQRGGSVVLEELIRFEALIAMHMIREAVRPRDSRANGVESCQSVTYQA